MGRDYAGLMTGITRGSMMAPLARALNGEIGAREALRESAEKANQGFAQRPSDWRL